MAVAQKRKKKKKKKKKRYSINGVFIITKHFYYLESSTGIKTINQEMIKAEDGKASDPLQSPVVPTTPLTHQLSDLILSWLGHHPN